MIRFERIFCRVEPSAFEMMLHSTSWRMLLAVRMGRCSSAILKPRSIWWIAFFADGILAIRSRSAPGSVTVPRLTFGMMEYGFKEGVMDERREMVVLKIAKQIDQAGLVEDSEWILSTRWAREVADRLVEAAEDPRNAENLVDRNAFVSLSQHVVEFFDGKIVAQRRDEVLGEISELLEGYLGRSSFLAP
jgi:hypothetical protein